MSVWRWLHGAGLPWKDGVEVAVRFDDGAVCRLERVVVGICLDNPTATRMVTSGSHGRSIYCRCTLPLGSAIAGGGAAGDAWTSLPYQLLLWQMK